MKIPWYVWAFIGMVLVGFVSCGIVAWGAEPSSPRKVMIVELKDSKDPSIVYERFMLADDSYIDILNARMKAARIRRFQPQHRMILFYGAASELEKRLGVKIVVPF